MCQTEQPHWDQPTGSIGLLLWEILYLDLGRANIPTHWESLHWREAPFDYWTKYQSPFNLCLLDCECCECYESIEGFGQLLEELVYFTISRIQLHHIDTSRIGWKEENHNQCLKKISDQQFTHSHQREGRNPQYFFLK